MSVPKTNLISEAPALFRIISVIHNSQRDDLLKTFQCSANEGTVRKRTGQRNIEMIAIFISFEATGAISCIKRKLPNIISVPNQIFFFFLKGEGKFHSSKLESAPNMQKSGYYVGLINWNSPYLKTSLHPNTTPLNRLHAWSAENTSDFPLTKINVFKIL